METAFQVRAATRAKTYKLVVLRRCQGDLIGEIGWTTAELYGMNFVYLHSLQSWSGTTQSSVCAIRGVQGTVRSICRCSCGDILWTGRF